MTEMFERVVQAVDRAIFADPLNRRAIARAAIEAMREPTQKMVDAADAKHDSCDGRTDMDEVWRDMIDAALEKEKADGTSAAR